MAAEIFAILSGVIVLIGAPFYLVDILKGKTKPQRTTWFIWTVQGTVALISQVQLGAHWSLWFAGLNALGNLVVFLLSLKYGVGGWQKIDVVALAVAIVGVLVSLIAHAPFVALLGVILADFAGSVPTFEKVYRLPSSETSITWFALGLSSFLAIFSVGNWKFSLILYPLYFTVDNMAVLVAQALGHYHAKHASPQHAALKH
jgi:hypothetical protein